MRQGIPKTASFHGHVEHLSAARRKRAFFSSKNLGFGGRGVCLALCIEISLFGQFLRTHAFTLRICPFPPKRFYPRSLVPPPSNTHTRSHITRVLPPCMVHSLRRVSDKICRRDPQGGGGRKVFRQSRRPWASTTTTTYRHRTNSCRVSAPHHALAWCGAVLLFLPKWGKGVWGRGVGRVGSRQ